jgi:acylphosphatase
MPNHPTNRTRVLYQGHVQGVGFRATCRSLAAHRPITGWVANQADGSVLLEAQGSPTALADFLQAIRERMPRNIHAEHTASVQPLEGESEFRIAR